MPIELFTFDLEITKLGLRFEKESDLENVKVLRYFRRKKVYKHLINIMRNQIRVSSSFEQDEDIKKCR